MIREDILQKFPGLFGSRKVNGREVEVERLIAELTQEFRPAIAHGSDGSPKSAAIHQAGTGALFLAQLGRQVRRSCQRKILDVPPDCSGPHR